MLWAPTMDVPESLDAAELAQRLSISTRTLRAWIQAGALPRNPFRGHNTRYDRAFIVRAHAVAALRRDGVPLPHISRFLKNKTELELREIGGLPPPSPPPALPAPPSAHALPASASGAEAPTTEAGSPHASSAQASEPGIADSVLAASYVARGESLAIPGPLATGDESRSHSAAPVGVEWRRIELLPGLELHVRTDAAPFVHGLAAAIAAGRFPK